jgi:hypothetical protein
MTLTQKLLKLVEIIHSDGGLAFLKIRYMLEDVQCELDKGNPQAAQFAEELERILRFCEMAAKTSVKSDT